jgi:segregation and condensation protein A
MSTGSTRRWPGCARCWARFPGWARLADFLPEDWRGQPARRRSATAATFAASLELARAGQIELRQAETFAPVELRRKPAP